MPGPLTGMRRDTGWAGGDARARPVFPARSAGLPWAVLGTGGGAAVQSRPGSVPVVLPGRRQVLAAHGPARGVAPCPVAGAPRAGCCPAGSAGCLPPPRVRGGRIEVIVAWRRARRFGRLCRRHQPSPGDAGQVPCGRPRGQGFAGSLAHWASSSGYHPRCRGAAPIGAFPCDRQVDARPCWVNSQQARAVAPPAGDLEFDLSRDLSRSRGGNWHEVPGSGWRYASASSWAS
jgi:hypothetical protein